MFSLHFNYHIFREVVKAKMAVGDRRMKRWQAGGVVGG